MAPEPPTRPNPSSGSKTVKPTFGPQRPQWLHPFSSYTCQYLSIHETAGSCGSTQTVRLPLAPPPGPWLITSSAVRAPRVLPISSLDHDFLIGFIPVNWNSFPGWFFSFCSDSWGEPTPLIFLEGYFPFSTEWNCNVAALVACGNQYKHLMRKVRQTGTSGRQHHQPLRKWREVQGGPDGLTGAACKTHILLFFSCFSSPAGAEPSWSSLGQARCCSCYQLTLLPVLLGSAVAPQTLRMPCLYFYQERFVFGFSTRKHTPEIKRPSPPDLQTVRPQALRSSPSNRIQTW